MVPEDGYGENADDEQHGDYGGSAGDDDVIQALASILRADVPREPSPARIAVLRDAVAAHAAAPDGRRGDSQVVDLDDRLATQLPMSRRSLTLVAATVAVLLVAGGAILGSVLARDYPSTGGELEYAGPITSDGGEVAGDLEVVKIGIGRVISLDTFDLPILPTSEYYEVWFVAPDDAPEAPNRISAGTFHPDADGRSEVTFAAAVDPAKYPVVEITAEPGDGDPSPTGPVVMRVQIAE